MVRQAALWVKFVLVLTACVTTSLTFAGRAGAAQVGAVGDITWGQPKTAIDQEIASLRAAGVRWVRTNINWAYLEPVAKGQIDQNLLAQYDYAIERARAAGLEVLMPISDGVPYWASADPQKYIDSSGGRHWNRVYKPSNMADYGDITNLVVSHFAPKGVKTFEIWNEPNLGWFWAPAPNPADYVAMLKAGYLAAKSVDQSVTVLLGGLSKNDFTFLEDVYQSGGRDYFDAVAVHPYTYGVDPTVQWYGVNAGEDSTRLSWNCFPAIKEIRKTMEAFGDGAKQVWLTEFGYSTSTSSGGVSETTQADYLTKAYKYVESLSWVHSMFWYAARNDPFRGEASSDYSANFGLTKLDFTPKPSYYALQAYTGAASTSSEPVQPLANAAPVVAITSPADGSKVIPKRNLTVTASASDDKKVARVEFWIDGRLAYSDSYPTWSYTWRVPRTISMGAHFVVARAFDGEGLSSSAGITLYR